MKLNLFSLIATLFAVPAFAQSTVNQGQPSKNLPGWGIQGVDAAGATNTQKPITIGGVDPSNKSKKIAVDATGNGGTNTGNTIVVGLTAAGSASTTNPVQAGNVDSSGNVRKALGDANGASATYRPPFVASGAPTFGGVAGNVTTTSASFCSLTSGAIYRVCCSAPVKFRTGAATPTALTTDTDIFGPICEPIGMRSADTCIAFITVAGTATCSGSLTSSIP